MRTLINGQGVVTFYSCTLMPPEVHKAMERASANYVEIVELQRAVGAHLAKFVDAEAAIPGGVLFPYEPTGLMREPVGCPGKDRKFTEISVDGGLLPKPVIKDSQQIWPAKRREVVVDFSKYMDGSPTKKGDVVYLVNVSKMGTGRMPEAPDANYKVPMLRFVVFHPTRTR